jgi:signal peptidase I
VNLWHEFMEYDSTERLLYSLAVLFTLWFALALLLKAKKKSNFREWGEAGFVAVWLALGIRILLVEAYSIPSESMVPTLLIKDHLVVGKLAFGWHLPGTQGRVLAWKKPKRGDIVIFVPPHQRKLSYVKRCVGLPGDSVEVRAKQVYINGQPAEHPFSYGRLATLAPASAPALQAAYEGFKAQANPRADSYQTTWLGPLQLPAGTYYEEAALGFVRVYARLIDQPGPGDLELMPKAFRAPADQQDWTAAHKLGNRDWFGPYKLQDGEYWMMGDNRDNSADSRYFGPVRYEALRGTPLFRYWPPSRMGLVR